MLREEYVVQELKIAQGYHHSSFAVFRSKGRKVLTVPAHYLSMEGYDDNGPDATIPSSSPRGVLAALTS